MLGDIQSVAADMGEYSSITAAPWTRRRARRD
jgi:hypothetical protein